MTSALRRIQWACFAVGIVLLAWYGLVVVQAMRYQTQTSLALDNMLASTGPPRGREVLAATRTFLGDRELIGRLDIPRLRLSVMVVDGDDDETLGLAAGHLPDTPFPWQEGNSAIAGHRDTFFRGLKDVHLNDRLVFVTPRGDFHYEVTRTLIVTPNDVWVVAPGGPSAITLVTCYPFSYVGHAPERFIVRAERIDEPTGKSH